MSMPSTLITGELQFWQYSRKIIIIHGSNKHVPMCKFI